MQQDLLFNLAFQVDSSAAQSQLQTLKTQLNQLIINPVDIGSKLTTDIYEASQAAAELQVHLQNATNVNTGNLDFSKLSSSLKKSGTSLQQYATQLQSLGPAGRQAFMSLANSVAMSEVPLKRVNKTLNGLVSSLKNTLNWQISSTVLHGFMGSIQKAYGYAQDLNKSLNDIRIVSGYSAEKMSRFAQEANSAAKALSTTTNEYAKASLIFYQQGGLTDAEVAQRTEATIKMANVSGQSAQTVSNQLTSVWNNFDDGSKSLEYYADVMTALGAATASSTDEIAEGLQKFSSISKTVGLSYEYAASALATVTATSRESADVVGTAFKTMFARIQGLKLGDTLEDGTTLNDYSAALAKVGVDIKDSNGELKQMDTILEDMAKVWTTLGNDEKMALAQKVAGVRQYTHLMTLMNNWDFMEENLATSYSSSGTINKQAEIYAESWEAAQKRVQAAAEEIYHSLIDDDFFIGLTNTFSDLLNGLNTFIDGVGGLGGVLSGLGMIATRVFKTQIAQGFRDMAYNLQMSTDVGIKMAQDQKAAEMANLQSLMATSDASTLDEIQTKKVYSQEIDLQRTLIENADKLSEEEQQRYQFLLKQHKAMGEQSIALAKQREELKAQASDISTTTIGEGMLRGRSFEEMSGAMTGVRELAQNSVNVQGFTNLPINLDDIEITKNSLEQLEFQLKQLGASDDDLKPISDALKIMQDEGELTEQAMSELKAKIGNISESALTQSLSSLKEMGATQDDIDLLAQAFGKLSEKGDTASLAMEEIQSILNKIAGAKIKDTLKGMGLEEGTAEYEATGKALLNYYGIQKKSEETSRQQENTNRNLGKTYKSLGDAIRGAAKEAAQDWADNLATMSSGLMSLGMLVSSINGLMDTINDPDATPWERFGAILTSVSMIATSLGGTFKGLKATISLLQLTQDKETISKIANAAATHLQEKNSILVQKHKTLEQRRIERNTKAINDETKAIIANEAAEDAADADDKIPDKPIEFKDRHGNKRVWTGDRTHDGVPRDKLGKFSQRDIKKHNIGNGGPSKEMPTGKTPKKGGKGFGKLFGKGAGTAGKGAVSSGSGAAGSLGGLGTAAASVAIIAAAVVAASAMIYTGVKAMNKAEDGFKEASNTAKDLSSAASTAKTELEGLSNSFDTLKDKKDALKGLTEGTLEYKMALQDSRQAAIDLILANDELTMADLTFDQSTGAYEISEDAQKRVLEKQMNEASMAQAASLKAQATKADSEQALQVDEFLEEKHKGGMWAGIGAGVVGGGVAGAALGSVIPGIGNAVGAVAGGIVGAGAGIMTALLATSSAIDKEAAAFDAIDFSTMDDPTQKLKVAAEALNLDYENLDNTMKEEIMALIANKEATDQNTEALLREANKETFSEEFADLTETEKNLAADAMGERTQNTANAVKAQLEKRWEGKLHGSEYEEAAALLGYEEGTEIKAIKGEDGVTRYNAVDASGETVAELGTLDAITTKISEEYAAKAAKGESLSQYTGNEDAVKALGGEDKAGKYDSQYKEGNNAAEAVAANYDFGLSGVAEEMLNNAVATKALTADELKGGVNNNVVKGLSAVANAEGSINEDFYTANKDAIDAYYKALTGTTDEAFKNVSTETILQKLNEVKEAGQEALETTEEATFDSAAEEAVADGLIESTEAFEAYIDTMLTADEKSRLTKTEQGKLGKELLKNQTGLKKAAEGMNSYNEALENNDAIAKANSLGKIAEGLNEVFGEDAFDATSVEEHMEKVQKALKGDAEALHELQAIAAKDYMVDLGIKIDPGSTAETINNWIAGQEFQDLKIGATLDSTGMTGAFEQMLYNGEMTVDEMNTLFEDKLGFTPEITYQDVPLKNAVQDKTTGNYTVQVPDPADPSKTITKTLTSEQYNTATVDGTLRIPVINGKATKKISSPSLNLNSLNTDSGSSSGGSEPKKAEAVDRDSVIKRHKETEDALDDVRDAAEKTNKEIDRLYGAARVAQIAKANKELIKETKLLKQKRKEAEAYLKLDKLAAEKAAKDVDITLQYDENGNITNYTTELDALVTAHEQKVETLNKKSGGASEEELKKLDEEKEKIEALTEAIDKYDETKESLEEIDNLLDDQFYTWQSNNFQMWSHSLEVTLDISDDALEMLDYYLGKTEGDFFKQAEGLALMGQQLAFTNVSMGTYVGYLGVLGSMKAQDQISQADFIEGLDQIQSGIMSNLQALQDLDDKMIHYYGETLQLARDEIDVLTDRMEHGTSVLEHYNSLLDLMGQQKDYKSHGIILEGRVNNLKNELDVLNEERKIMERELETKKYLAEHAFIPGSAEVYQQQYEDALAAASETQEEFLAKAEEYAEALNDQLENTLNLYRQNLEDTLTGGKTFDLMSKQMEHKVSLQEEYLTATNKIYETEKLMNKAQQEIDKTSNSVAKRKLKQFIDETNQLKEKGQLSKFELETQQAKYELLVAEIALEEAQKTKSKVRLQRDAEGNFGYIYTAEAEEVAKAEEEYADKQNAFYNKALEGINNYAEKYCQTLEEMFSALEEIEQNRRDGMYKSEQEYEAAVLEAQQYYYGKLRQFSEIFNIAIQLDTEATKDSWGQDYQDMVNSTDKWETSVNDHVDSVSKAFDDWELQMEGLSKTTETNMGSLASSVSKVTEESNELTESLMKDGGLLDQIEVELGLVSSLTSLYASLRWAVLAAAAAYEMLAIAIMTVKAVSAIGSSAAGLADIAQIGNFEQQVGDGLDKKETPQKTEDTAKDSSPLKMEDLKVGDKLIFKDGKYFETSAGTGTSGSRGQGQEVTITHINPGSDKPIHVKGGSGGAYGWLDIDQLSRYDTGGYTGAWGSYGKLAVLDEKELVLDKNDTKNLLTSMELLNSIISTVDLYAANQSLGSMLRSPNLGAVKEEMLEQSVSIEAHFPNVSSRVEIEEAFSTLINRASQYANRK